MSTILSLKEKKELNELLPDFDEETFIKEAVSDKIRTLKGLIFLSISEEIRKNLIKQGYSIEQLVKDFND